MTYKHLLTWVCFSLIGYVPNTLYNMHLYLSTLIPLSGVGTTCFSSCCDKDSAFIFTYRPPAWRQPSLKLEWIITTTNGAGISSLTCFPKHGGARDNKFLVTHPMTDLYEQCLGSAIARWAHWPLNHRAPPLYNMHINRELLQYQHCTRAKPGRVTSTELTLNVGL
jgi:hypothetical protein